MAFELGAQTLILHRRVPVVDGNGVPVLDAYGRKQITPDDVTVTGCDFEATESLEEQSATTVVRLDGRGMLPPGTECAYADAVTWNGIKFELHGPPRPVSDIGSTAIDHIEISGRSSLDSSNPDSREEG